MSQNPVTTSVVVRHDRMATAELLLAVYVVSLPRYDSQPLEDRLLFDTEGGGDKKPVMTIVPTGRPAHTLRYGEAITISLRVDQAVVTTPMFDSTSKPTGRIQMHGEPVEAVQYTADGPVPTWMLLESKLMRVCGDGDDLLVQTAEGEARARYNDWIVRRFTGDLLVVRNDRGFLMPAPDGADVEVMMLKEPSNRGFSTDNLEVVYTEAHGGVVAHRPPK